MYSILDELTPSRKDEFLSQHVFLYLSNRPNQYRHFSSTLSGFLIQLPENWYDLILQNPALLHSLCDNNLCLWLFLLFVTSARFQKSKFDHDSAFSSLLYPTSIDHSFKTQDGFVNDFPLTILCSQSVKNRG